MSDEDIEKLKDYSSLANRINPSVAKTEGINIVKLGLVLGIAIVSFLLGYYIINSFKDKEEFVDVIETKDEIKEKPFTFSNNKFTESIVISNIEKGCNWITKSNTAVIIKPNSLIDKSGDAATGEVTLVIKEYKDAVDAVLAGIPMEYDSADYTYNFRTRGMFELRAYKDGEDLQIADNKRVEVLLSSYSSRKSFNTYYFDTISNKWNYTEANKVLERDIVYNKTNDVVKVDIPTSKPIVLDFDPDEFPEFRSYENTKFYPLRENKDKMNKLEQTDWEDIELSKKGDHYSITAFNRNEELVIEVMSSIQLEKLTNKKLNKSDSVERKINVIKYVWPVDESLILDDDEYLEINNPDLSFSAQYQYSPSMQSIINSRVVSVFSMEKFGIWNCDAPEKLPKGLLAKNVNFIDKDSKDTLEYNGSYYLTENDRQLMYKYYRNNEFSCNPKQDNCLWFIHLIDKKPHLFFVNKDNFELDENDYFRMNKVEIDPEKMNPLDIKRILNI